jgi:putative peptidoglycan lipid II flippase
LVLIELGIGIWRLIHEDPALRLTAIMMPYMVLICIAAVASGVLNVREHFAVPAAAPTILNVAMIVALFLGGVAGLDAAALMDWNCGSVLLAGVIQVVATGVALHMVGFFPVWGRAWRDPQLRIITSWSDGPGFVGGADQHVWTASSRTCS